MSETIRRRPLVAFFVLAFAISWIGVSVLAAAGAGLIDATPAPWHHVFGALGPCVSALIVCRVTGGTASVRRLLGRLRPRGISPLWWALGVGSPFALLAIALVSVRIGQGAWPSWATVAEGARSPAWLVDVAIASVAYGFGEEIGWRGFALPRLQASHGALVATVILAVFWGAWHFPFFFYRFDFGGPAMIAGFFVGIFAGAIWLAFLLNSTGGNILIVALWHMSWNVVNMIGLRLSDDVVAVMSGLVIALAAIVLVIGRPSRLSVREKYVEAPR